MLARRTFGKLGKRAAGRISLDIEGGMTTPGQSRGCAVVNVSRDGCCLEMDNAPRQGTDMVIKIERVETLGWVIWSRGDRCGVKFAEPISQSALARLRWIVHHSEQHKKNITNSATAMWR